MRVSDAEWADFMRTLTYERFQPVPQANVAVDGPQRAMMIEEAALEAQAARVVRSLTTRRSRMTIDSMDLDEGSYEITSARFEREA